MLLRYPEQRLARWYERAFVVLAGLWLIGWQILVTTTWPRDGGGCKLTLALVATELYFNQVASDLEVCDCPHVVYRCLNLRFS